MDAELLTLVQNLFNLWETKNLPGELAMTTDGCVWEHDGLSTLICHTRRPHNLVARLHSNDATTRLTAYFELGRQIEHSRQNLHHYRQRVAPFSLRAARRTYSFFKICGVHRIGLNPVISATRLARCSALVYDELLMNEQIADLLLDEPQ